MARHFLSLLPTMLLLAACRPPAGTVQLPPTPTVVDEPATVVGDGQRVTSIDSNWDGFGEAVDVRGNLALIGASEWNYFGEGYAYLYRHVDGVWQEEAQLAADDRSPIPPQEPRELVGQRFGSDVALAENVLVVGAPGTDPTRQGAVYVFEHDGRSWIQTAKLSQPQASSDDAGSEVSWLVYGRLLRRQFGQLVALHGTTLVVGGDAVNQALYVYERDDNGWQRRASINVPARQGSDLYMVSMALYSDTLALSSYYVDHDQPPNIYNLLVGDVVVTVYERDDGRWQETLRYTPQGDAPLFLREARLGASVALSGNSMQATRLAIGLPGFPDLSAIADLRQTLFLGAPAPQGEPGPGYPASPLQAGIVTIFERNDAGVWREQARLTLAGDDTAPGPGLFFQTLTEGSFDEQALREKVFPGHFWSADPATTFFGATVDLDAERLAVTSAFADATYVFERDPGGAWRHLAFLRSDDGEVSEDYAQIVALSDDTILLGTPGEFGNSAIFFNLTSTP